MTLISIILPTYNGSKYISKAIESCLKQTFQSFELIIVNDCSDDNTRDILEEYQSRDSRIKVIDNESNLKLPSSLNIGFGNACGDFLTWTSDDNFFAPSALERLVSVLEGNEEIDIVYSSYSFIDDKDNVLGYYGHAPENLLFSCVVGACFLYRKNVHEELNGYAVDKFRMEDMDFWLRAAQKFRFYFIDEKDLYYYRKHNHSLTNQIYKNSSILDEYRQNYANSFNTFFNEYLNAGFTQEDIENHVKIFFEDLLNDKNLEFELSDVLISYLNHLGKLSKLDWGKVSFNNEEVLNAITMKRDRIVSIVINDLIFNNKRLASQNPTLAKNLTKPISWYYSEYEVLPRWYKRVGHLIKMLQGNKPIPFFTNRTLR